MLKPDALDRKLVLRIMDRFIQNGFHIEMIDYRIVDIDLIVKHYFAVIERMGNIFINMASDYFVNKPVIAMIISIENNDAINLSRRLIGVTDPEKSDIGTIRHDFSDDSLEKALKENRCVRNLIHSSDSLDTFKKEIALWFGQSVLNKFGGNEHGTA